MSREQTVLIVRLKLIPSDRPITTLHSEALYARKYSCENILSDMYAFQLPPVADIHTDRFAQGWFGISSEEEVTSRFAHADC